MTKTDMSAWDDASAMNPAEQTYNPSVGGSATSDWNMTDFSNFIKEMAAMNKDNQSNE